MPLALVCLLRAGLPDVYVFDLLPLLLLILPALVLGLLSASFVKDPLPSVGSPHAEVEAAILDPGESEVCQEVLLLAIGSPGVRF